MGDVNHVWNCQHIFEMDRLRRKLKERDEELDELRRELNRVQAIALAHGSPSSNGSGASDVPETGDPTVATA